MDHCPDCGAALLAEDQAHCHACGADLSRYESLVHAGTEGEDQGERSGTEFERVTENGASATESGAEDAPRSQEIHAREPIVYDLDELTGHEFEEAVATVFERRGYETELPGKAADRGRDVIAQRGGKILVIECKHQKGSVGRPVVQKLHSATTSYREADRGLVITTGSFADTAREHAVKLRRTGGVPIELWGHDRLLQEARQADVYFTLGREGTQYIFRPELRSRERAERKLWQKHLEGLGSSPRDKERVVEADHELYEYTPGVIVAFEVDERFSSQTYELYHAKASGRALFALEETGISQEEEEHWQSARYNVTCEDTVDGRPAVSYFGEPLSRFEDQVALEVARRLSRTVEYEGRNNQTYTKRCEVDAVDVSTDAKQVMLVHHDLAIDIGPSDHRVLVTADRQQSWAVSRTEGFRDGDAGFRDGSGYICNDCGLISPRDGGTAGAACRDCGRTLCSAHHWTWPRKAPWPSHDLCSGCYREKDHTDQHLTPDETFLDDFWKVAGLGLLPGVTFLTAGRRLAGMALLPLWLVYLSALGLVAKTGDVAVGAALLGIAALVSLSAALHWSTRIQRHRSNIEELDGYEPEWQPDAR